MTAWLARNWRTSLLATLIAAGLVALYLLPVTPEQLLATGERLASHPLAMALIVIGMMLLFALALPGSLGFWLLAPFHPPLVSTPLLLLGSVGGAWGGYLLARRLGMREGRVHGGRLGRLLQRRSDFITQCALRILPGFPHSVINYVAGGLGLPPGRFLLAAILGLTVKWGVYSSAVHSMVEAVSEGGMVGFDTLWPLVVVAVLLFAGGLLRHRLGSGG